MIDRQRESHAPSNRMLRSRAAAEQHEQIWKSGKDMEYNLETPLALAWASLLSGTRPDPSELLPEFTNVTHWLLLWKKVYSGAGPGTIVNHRSIWKGSSRAREDDMEKKSLRAEGKRQTAPLFSLSPVDFVASILSILFEISLSRTFVERCMNNPIMCTGCTAEKLQWQSNMPHVHARRSMWRMAERCK
jgi:hypothetical protein